MRVLVIEDDRVMVRAMAFALSAAGIQHRIARSGKDGLALARSCDFDAILLDLGLPDVHGYEVLAQLRSAHVAMPIIIVSGDAETATKITGFDRGADDYMTKPFAGEELTALLHALVRRSQSHAQSIVRTGSMTIDLKGRTVDVLDRRVTLTGKEYAILEMLSLRKGQTLAKKTFLSNIYNGRDQPEIKIIDVFVCKLRKKLADVDRRAATCIETVWGQGYALRDPESEQARNVA